MTVLRMKTIIRNKDLGVINNQGDLQKIYLLILRNLRKSASQRESKCTDLSTKKETQFIRNDQHFKIVITEEKSLLRSHPYLKGSFMKEVHHQQRKEESLVHTNTNSIKQIKITRTSSKPWFKDRVWQILDDPIFETKWTAIKELEDRPILVIREILNRHWIRVRASKCKWIKLISSTVTPLCCQDEII